MFSVKAAGISQEIDPQISAKIIEFANEVKSIHEMKRLLKIFVRDDLFNKTDLPDSRNRRFFPRVVLVIMM